MGLYHALVLIRIQYQLDRQLEINVNYFKQSFPINPQPNAFTHHINYIAILTFAVMSDLNRLEADRLLDPHLSITRRGRMNEEHL